MKILLRNFQERAVDDLVGALHSAASEVKQSPRSKQAAWLSAATGSGKTLIATAAIERLLEGDKTYSATLEATFLWLSDQPELNEQTRRKMLSSSSVLGPSDLVVIGSTFDEEVLPPGRVHFLNIQKLSKEAGLVKQGDSRTFTIWQTIANTIARRPASFFLLIDEAHRGTAEKPAFREEATTIMQKFIKGSEADGLPPVPLIAGISATPERFQRLIGGAGRVQRPVEVPADDVRESGLLKDFIDVHHPARGSQASDITMLGQAAKAWCASWGRWETYCKSTGDEVVRPILVVQVQDGTAKELTKTDLEQAVMAIRRAAGAKADELLPPRAFAHAFQEGKAAKAGSLEIRHLNPSDIVDDAEVRVVFFKSSLNTGWDCPRAETMMSFRTALDATLIAQLVGRMVRTPLARRVEVDESLNSVALYLPHYDAANLDKVVAKLTGDPDTGLPVEVRRGADVVDLVRAKGSNLYFEALAELPSYVVPKARRTSQVKRLTKFAFLLANDGIDEEAPDKATGHLLSVLRAEYDKRRETESFQQDIKESASVYITGRRVRLGVGEEAPLEERTTARAGEDLDTQFEEAGRKLGEGLHKVWWRERVNADESARDLAKLEAITLAEPAVVAALEDAAQTTTQEWLRTYKKEIANLNEASRLSYVEVRELATRPEVVDREPYPERIQVTKADKRWPEHVYVDEVGLYPSKLNKWETRVIEQQLAKKGEVIAWLRNPPRKPWSVTIPYSQGGEDHPQYPDFLVLRRTRKGDIVVDLLEPHMTDLADASAKAYGLAKYADRHADKFGRIEFIIVDEDDNVVSLDLNDERWRKKVLVFTEGGDAEKLRALLKEAAAS